MPSEYREKIGNLRGVSEWKALDSAGDVKRLLRWILLSIRDNTLDPKTGAIMGQLGSYMLKAVETADLEQKIEKIQQQLGSPHERIENPHGTTTH